MFPKEQCKKMNFPGKNIHLYTVPFLQMFFHHFLGWMGENCTEACRPGYFGPDCSSLCRCKNGGTCDRSGRCTCAPGWKGPSCTGECNEGTYGENCNSTCTCQHDGLCDHVTGGCRCQPGYQGVNCERLCDEGGFNSRKVG